MDKKQEFLDKLRSKCQSKEEIKIRTLMEIAWQLSKFNDRKISKR